MTIKERFIAKSKKFRLYFQLTEDQIDLLLLGKNLVYKGVESQHHILTLEMMEKYPLIYGLDWHTFEEDTATYPLWDELPEATKKIILDTPYTAADDVGKDGLKNTASYIILAIKHLNVGTQFSESEIMRCLPYPLNKGVTIYQTSGLLKGAFKKLRRSRKFKDEKGNDVIDPLYQIHKPIDEHLIGKAKRKLEK
ncbi:hypothetical protein HCX49_01930 [Sphingobacterium kitahiroshimense]|uniref:hypothetical protein n=1 Tax=Sphingobacterium sp. B16(2022) TaxID=2914044 RepID=UPI00143BCF9D|nr:hypothetical protein [Sphingobacterium sp. B16(2022)]NJI71955.1 hypothetical protein [Sphingobacterium sp. B16(2022)]